MARIKRIFKTGGYAIKGGKGTVEIYTAKNERVWLLIDFADDTTVAPRAFLTEDIELFAVNILKALKSNRLKK